MNREDKLIQMGASVEAVEEQKEEKKPQSYAEMMKLNFIKELEAKIADPDTDEKDRESYKNNKDFVVEEQDVRLKQALRVAINKGGMETEKAFAEYEKYRLSGVDDFERYIEGELGLAKGTDGFRDKFNELCKTHNYYSQFIENANDFSDEAMRGFPGYQEYQGIDSLEEKDGLMEAEEIGEYK